jgi:hypothetical protein
MTWLGTAALTTLAATAISAGAILPAVLWSLATATVATDEIVHIKKHEPPFIAKSISNLIVGVVAPIAMAVLYPVVVAGSAISDAIKENRAERKARKMARELNQSKDYTHEYNPTAVHEPESTVTPTTPTIETPTGAPDFSNYYLADEPAPAAGGEYIEELEETEPRLEPPTSDDDPQNVD